MKTDKYILENWVNGDYVNNSLRRITRENSRYLISDVQRTAKNWKAEPIKYVRIYKWATKFVKDNNNQLGIRRSISNLSNTDGVMTHSITNDPSTLKCKYTFDEIFGNDLRDIQHPESYPVASLIRQEQRDIKRKIFIDPKERFRVEMTEYNFETKNHIEGWDMPLAKYLKELFKVDKVYYIWEKIIEHDNQSIITKAGTFFHVNHFSENKKEITFEENYYNRTIMFWLFDDKLVFQYEDGKNTW